MPRVTTPERFWARVAIGQPDECWEWQGRRDDKGYGRVGLNGRRNQKVSRVAWQLTHGVIPDGLLALHRCDNPPCCNPGHLFLGTQLDNIADRNAKGRTRAAKPGEDHFAAKLTNAQVAELRRRYAAGGITQRELAAEYGIARGTVAHIVIGRTYASAA